MKIIGDTNQLKDKLFSSLKVLERESWKKEKLSYIKKRKAEDFSEFDDDFFLL